MRKIEKKMYSYTCRFRYNTVSKVLQPPSFVQTILNYQIESTWMNPHSSTRVRIRIPEAIRNAWRLVACTYVYVRTTVDL